MVIVSNRTIQPVCKASATLHPNFCHCTLTSSSSSAAAAAAWRHVGQWVSEQCCRADDCVCVCVCVCVSGVARHTAVKSRRGLNKRKRRAVSVPSRVRSATVSVMSPVVIAGPASDRWSYESSDVAMSRRWPARSRGSRHLKAPPWNIVSAPNCTALFRYLLLSGNTACRSFGPENLWKNLATDGAVDHTYNLTFTGREGRRTTRRVSQSLSSEHRASCLLLLAASSTRLFVKHTETVIDTS